MIEFSEPVDRSWSPGVEVAVHADELIITIDHLPADHAFAAELQDGGMWIHSTTPAGVEDHCLHLPLPDGIAIGEIASAMRGEAFEVHLRLPIS
jgi:hypothetical protein